MAVPPGLRSRASEILESVATKRRSVQATRVAVTSCQQSVGVLTRQRDISLVAESQPCVSSLNLHALGGTLEGRAGWWFISITLELESASASELVSR